MPTPDPTKLVIHNGRVIDPASGFDRVADVLVVGDRVARIDGSISEPDAATFDAEGCIVAPGLIDIHVHLRDPGPEHEETILSGAAAAINGGFTTVCCMPNTQPPLDTPEQIERVGQVAGGAEAARVFAVGCATVGRAGEEVADLEGMTAAGAVGFTDDGSVVADAGVMRDVLLRATMCDRVVMQHCQVPSLTRGASMNAGPVAERMRQIGWPAVAEELIVERDVRLNREIGCRYHVQHLSSGESVPIVRRAQAWGSPVTAEVSPHHLLLTDADCETLGTMAKMNPPLRTGRDIALLKEGVADGTITVLATDHAPHPLATKRVDFARASFGIVGLDCALPLYARALVEDGVIEWPAMLAMMTSNPARLVGLDRRGLGMLREGGPADVTVIDPAIRWTIEAGDFASRARNCPFDGWAVTGRALHVLVAGRPRLLRTPERLSAGSAETPAPR